MAILAALGVVALVVTITTEVIARGIFGRSIPGALELSESLLVWIIFLGLAYGEANATHVRMTLVTDRLPFKVAQVLRGVGYTLTTIVIGWMTYSTGTRAVNSLLQNEIRQGLLQWSLWPARVVLCVGLAVLTLHCALRLWELFQGKLPTTPYDDDVTEVSV